MMMVERLANVIWWTTTILAAIILYNTFKGTHGPSDVDTFNVGFGVFVFLFGGVIYYILAGPIRRRYVLTGRQGGSDMGMTKWIPGAKMWRETFVAGATNTGNVTATVGNKLVLNWHGTPTQRDGVLQMFPVIRDKLMPGVELGSCADAIIASIHDGGMSPNNNSNIQSLAMLWRVFTTRLDDGTYGDLIAHTNMHATFELHEQPNDQFKITWKISVMRGRTP